MVHDNYGIVKVKIIIRLTQQRLAGLDFLKNWEGGGEDLPSPQIKKNLKQFLGGIYFIG
jgi:hypothetical protein